MCINYIKTEFNPKYSDFSVIRIFGWWQFLSISQHFQFVLLQIIIIIIIIIIFVFCCVRCYRFKEFFYNFGCWFFVCYLHCEVRLGGPDYRVVRTTSPPLYSGWPRDLWIRMCCNSFKAEFNRVYVCMYVCMCVCLYIYIYIYIHTHTHTHKRGGPKNSRNC